MNDFYIFLIAVFGIAAVFGFGVIVAECFERRSNENELNNWWVQQDQDDQWVDSQ